MGLYGSLAATGEGHSTPLALALGLLGHLPHEVDPTAARPLLANIWASSSLPLAGSHPVRFGRSQIIWNPDKLLPLHSNGMQFSAFDAHGALLDQEEFYSIGGGFFVDRQGLSTDNALAKIGDPDHRFPEPRFPFHSATELFDICRRKKMSIAEVMLANEAAWTKPNEIVPKLLHIWSVMNDCIERGLRTEGVLPGGLNVRRRAPGMAEKLRRRKRSAQPMDWMAAYAIAVNEENAAGGRIVIAPTAGASGIIPAVLRYLMDTSDDWTDEKTVEFLCVAGAIAMIYKHGASISAAEVGCQGEVGVACSMAAGAFCSVEGGSIEQIEDAAEVGMEHNIGLSCDPIGGLVQIPCIERNVMGAAKAVSAARLALLEDGQGMVSLDEIVKTMLQTGQEMNAKFKETSEAGLAKNTRISANVTEC